MLFRSLIYEYGKPGIPKNKVKKLQNEKKELFQSLELFYKIFIQGVDINSLVNE